ncbi:hypothetical protein RFI_29849 [Reticulomyxa filosa]|uniref:Uncharacterized protein n=1 Tax=Reticulomyxa filosa TaxID=46433 RepID=X6M1Q9_RETFI|nr:hypothetical protein RFI_29849 [Reticulomyxa filosa]|eukprot:ETO07541.1 hypothetical protein RFI_29849 [Reticulomyxa filosa]
MSQLRLYSNWKLLANVDKGPTDSVLLTIGSFQIAQEFWKVWKQIGGEAHFLGRLPSNVQLMVLRDIVELHTQHDKCPFATQNKHICRVGFIMYNSKKNVNAKKKKDSGISWIMEYGDIETNSMEISQEISAIVVAVLCEALSSDTVLRQGKNIMPKYLPQARKR